MLTSQVSGGRYVFEFIQLPNTARATALGDYAISAIDGDGALAYQNPSLLNPKMHQSLSFNHNFYLSDIGTGYFSYAHHLSKSDLTIHGGIQFIQYGEFNRTDEVGNVEGTFRASEYALTGGVGKQLYDRLNVGSNLRLVLSNLEGYNATGIGLDLAATYHIEEKNLILAVVLQNASFQISSYFEESEAVPFDLQLAFSKRLAHLPFRFSVTAHTLNRWDIRYDDPNLQQDDIIFGGDGTDDQGGGFVDNLFRHLVFSGEFLLGKDENVHLRFGYNHLRKQEMKIGNFRTISGFSMGFGIRISKFRIDYGFGNYHLSGGVHHLGISTSLSRFKSNGMLDSTQ